MRNAHVWKTRTADGEKCEMQAEKFGKKWRTKSYVASDGFWRYQETISLEDLLALHDVIWRKYQRKRLAYDDVQSLEKLILEAGGEVPVYE